MPDRKPLCSSRVAAAALSLLAAALITAPAAQAMEGGYSNYGPGFYGDFGVAVAPAPGFYLRKDFYYYSADESRGRFVQNREIRAGLDLRTAMCMTTGLMVLEREVLGGRYAFGAAVPVVYSELSSKLSVGARTVPDEADRLAIGDVGVVPASLFWSFGNLHLNVYESVMVPIGSYDKDRTINGGLNYWSFDTVLAATYLDPKRGHELSAAVGYIYNTENHDTTSHRGQEVHVDCMVNQFLSEKVAVGLHGFYYKQVTGDSGKGAILGDFKGEAAGIGPAAMYATKIRGKDLILTAKWLHEVHAEHRLAGDHVLFSVTLGF